MTVIKDGCVCVIVVGLSMLKDSKLQEGGEKMKLNSLIYYIIIDTYCFATVPAAVYW